MENPSLPHGSLSATAEPSEVENDEEKKLTLPHELIVEILLRLPVRSLLRFKCVCTSWFFLISNTHFAKSHFDLNAAPVHRLLLLKEDKVESFDLQSSLKDRSTVLTLHVPTVPEFESPPCDDNLLYFLGSCRGFMLLGYARTGDIVVWNPTTRFHQHVDYIECGWFMSRYLYGFGYDKSTDDYFVVLVGLSGGVNLKVFSVNADSWYNEFGKHVNVQYMKLEPEESNAGVYLNDSLHWLVKSTDTNLLVIVVLHLLDKSLSEIPLPPEFAAHDLTAPKEYHLRVLAGCLSLCYSSGGRRHYRTERLWVVGDGSDGAEIWVMKEYKVQSSWTKAFVMTFCDIPCKYFYPICFTKGGGVVGSNGNGRLMKFNAKGELLEHRKYKQKYKNVRNYFEVFRESLLLFPGEQPHNFKEAIKHKYPTLPTELITEILLRLPVRSLLRLKCVCKSWSSLISDPQFAKSHFDLNAAPTDCLLLRFLDEDRDRVESFDLETSLNDRSTVKTLHVPSPSMWCNHNPLYFLGSCRGFMLLAYEHTGDVIVWNPTTGFDKQIPDIDHEFMFSYLCGFGYDSLSDDYFVVVITLFRTYFPETEMHCFSLKSNSWCDTKYVNVHYMDYGHDSTHGVFLNDSLHWLVIYNDTKLPVVIAFDLGKKSLSDIPLSPELATKMTRKVYYLRVLGGCLSLCYSGGSGRYERAEIWVMKEYKVQSSWTKAFVMTNSCDVPCNHFYPICFNEGGRVVGTNGRGRLIKFNAKGIVLEHLKYDREYKHVQKYFEMYRESLLFFPGEERYHCVTEDEGSENAEEKTIEDEEATEGEDAKASEDEYATEDEYYSEDEYSTDEEYSTGDEYATEDEEEEATEDEDGIEEEETTDDEEEN